LWTTLTAALMTAITGDIDGKIMTEQQPMKMAAAEALYHTSQPASFSVFTIGSLDGKSEVWSLRLPHLLSFLATGSFNGSVAGIDNVQAAEVAKYGPGVYTPVIPVTYWSFRLMIGFGLLAALVALAGLWFTRRGRVPGPERPWFHRFALWGVLFAPLASSFGWIFTEMGRQPWSVFGVLTTRESVSPTVGAGTIWTSLIVLTALYGVLAVIEIGLMMRTARKGPELEAAPDESQPQLGFAY
jgi:cytochrome d ubiquinol oxidase subunit I